MGRVEEAMIAIAGCVMKDSTAMDTAFIALLKAFTMARTTRAVPLLPTNDYLFQYFQSL